MMLEQLLGTQTQYLFTMDPGKGGGVMAAFQIH